MYAYNYRNQTPNLNGLHGFILNLYQSYIMINLSQTTPNYKIELLDLKVLPGFVNIIFSQSLFPIWWAYY